MALVDANHIPQSQRKSKIIPVRCRFCARPVTKNRKGQTRRLSAKKLFNMASDAAAAIPS
jgi:hypothetical protein